MAADTRSEVRLAAGESLVLIAAEVKPEDIMEHVLSIVLNLAHDLDQEELRMTAAGLFNNLAEFFGADLCQFFVCPEIISLSEDAVFRVRKSCALNISNVVRIASEEIIRDRLMPAFIRLCGDAIWGVRKACAKVWLPYQKLSMRAKTKAARGAPGVSIGKMEEFMADVSKWVRSAALQHLGPLISTLSLDQITPTLLNSYTSMGSGSQSIEMSYYCAYSFPAVVQRLGADRWPELKPTFDRLCHDVQWKVRRHCRFPYMKWRLF